MALGPQGKSAPHVRAGNTLFKDATAQPVVALSAYAAGQVMGGKIRFAAAQAGVGSGLIQSVRIADNDKQSAAIDVVFFRAEPAVYADKSTFAPSQADLDNIVAVVSVTASQYAAFSANSVATAAANGLPFQLTGADTTDLWAILVCRGTPTYTNTGNLQVAVGILQD